MEVDVVLTYVDSTDLAWQKSFAQHKIAEHDTKVSYYRQTGLLKYVLRGIAKHMPWIRKIFLVVASDAQVPNWIDRQVVTVITHEKIIPSALLPTFNSTTIELFLWKIPDLAEHFIYFNDDMFAVNKLAIDNFFSADGKPFVQLIRQHHMPLTSWGLSTKMETEVLYHGAASELFIYPAHVATAHTKNIWKLLWDKYSQELMNNATKFRTATNFNQYAAIYFGLTNDLIVEKNTISSNLFSLTSDDLSLIVLDLKTVPKRQLICINDIDDNLTRLDLIKARQLLDVYVGSDKCIYEK